MPSFTNQDLDYLQKLCRIDLDPHQEKDVLQSLQKVLGFVQKLDKLDTSNVTPTSHVLGNMQKNVFRKDIVQKTSFKEKFLDNAPEKIGGMIKVPPIMTSQE